jgi:hypothetical protein
MTNQVVLLKSSVRVYREGAKDAKGRPTLGLLRVLCAFAVYFLESARQSFGLRVYYN